MDNLEAIKVVVFWSALNLALMLALAINVFRWRAKERIAVGISNASDGLQRSVRAHGNNTEYVPGIVVGLLMMALLGESTWVLNIAGAVLLFSRVLHAIGIQQVNKALPMARVVGNIVCWLLFALIIGRLVVLTW